MSSKEYHELTVIDSSVTRGICSIKCGSKCCNTRLAEHYVPINLVDYANLHRLRVHHMITYYSTVEKPQLRSKFNGDCVFLSETSRECLIYEYRPIACRKYPFSDDDSESTNIPDWCELYHRSSNEVKKQRNTLHMKMNQTELNIKYTIENPVTMEYLKKERDRHVDVEQEFFYEYSVSKKNSISIIETQNENNKQIFNEILDNITENIEGTDWVVYRLSVYDGNFNPIGNVYGLNAQQEKMTELIPSTEPLIDDFIRLLDICKSAKGQKEHYLDGVYFTESIQPIINERKQGALPINFEFQ